LTKYLNGVVSQLTVFVLILFMLPVGLTSALINLRPPAQAGASLQVDNSNRLGAAATQTSDSNQYLTLAQNASDLVTQITETDTLQKQMVTRLELSGVWQGGQLWIDTLGVWATNLKSL
jgi:hypothetical protein